MPRRSSATAAGIEARARGRARRSTRVCGSTSRYTDTLGAPECRTALTIASRAASSSGCRPAAGQSRTRTTSTGTPCSVSTSAASAFERGAERAVARRRPRRRRRRSSHAAQLALLHAREPHDLARIVGAALHERERLQHRVVQVRGDLGALVGADALAPLAHELRATAPTRRDR